MSTIKTTNITHGSNSGTANMVLASDGKVTIPEKKLYCPGAVVQVVSTTKTDVWTESCGEGAFSSNVVTGLTPSITPTASSSKILLTGYVVISNDAGGAWGAGIVLCNGTTAIPEARGGAVGSRSQLSGKAESSYLGTCIPINFLDSPATTNAITYGIKVWNGHTSTQNISINYTNDSDSDNNNHIRAASTLTLMEIAGT